MEASIINTDDILEWHYCEPEDVYDITVADNSNFYLATQSSPILVHNCGKSEFIDQIAIKLAELHGWSFGIFSAENQPEELHFTKLAEKYIGKRFYHYNNADRMNVQELCQAKLFIDSHFYFININEQNVTLDGLLKKTKELILKKGINALIIDPWNYLEHKIPSNLTETQYISQALSKISQFAKINDIHIILCAHPTKMQKDKEGNYLVATLYDIAGSANFFNKTDNGISVYRDYQSGLTEVYVQKIRFKFIGKVGYSSFEWNRETGQYSETSSTKY